MRKILNILIAFISVIFIILGLTFVFIESRLLVSLDWKIYDNTLNGFIRYLFRLLISIYVIFVSTLELISLWKNNKFINNYLLYFDISLVIISFFLVLFTTNYLGTISYILVMLLISLKVFKTKNATN